MDINLDYQSKPGLSQEDKQYFRAISLLLKKDVIQLIDKAGSGHIGGSLSCLDLLIMLYSVANISPQNTAAPDRDKIIISMGHVSPALYCVLAAYGFVSKTDLFENYRRKAGLFEGHPNNCCNGVEWCNGCLGQGLSQGCGAALAQKMRKQTQSHVYVLMGDGEQSKGQIQEAIEFATSKGLSHLTVLVDRNRQQSSGETASVLEVPIEGRYRAAGWQVLEIDGHDSSQIFDALREAKDSDRPTCIVAQTVMGKDIPFIENDWHYHGQRLDATQIKEATAHLEQLLEAMPKVTLPLRPWNGVAAREPVDRAGALLGCDHPRTYACNEQLDGRKACANVLKELAAANEKGSICVLDCDLASGLGIAQLNEGKENVLVECGIQEHDALSVAGGIAASGIKTFFMGFGIFSMGEPFNQIRVIDQNHIPLKIVATHCGVDVGQDGKSHQFIDYIALANALLETELVLPADPNQADRALRYIAQSDRGGIVATPRSTLPVLQNEKGRPLFGDAYSFVYGQADWIRQGSDATIITYGVMVHKALESLRLLAEKQISCGILNIPCPKQLDEAKILEAAATGVVLVVEDHNEASGLGAMIGAFLMERQAKCSFAHMGVTDYGISAAPDIQFLMQHLTETDMAAKIQKMVAKQ